jgi:hypothetical protein
MNVEQLAKWELVREKTSSNVTLFTTYIPHDTTWDRTRVAEVGSR